MPPWVFSRTSLSGNTLEQSCQPSENLVHPSSFTWINPVHPAEFANHIIQDQLEKSIV